MENEDNSNSYITYEDDDVVIEEITSENLAENELSEFIPMNVPFDQPGTSSMSHANQSSSFSTDDDEQLYDAKDIPAEQEEILIKKLINGEMTFLDYNQQIGRIVDDSIDEQDDIEMLEDDAEEEEQQYEEESTQANSSNVFEKELMQSRKDVMRGNLKGRSVNKDGKVQRRRCMLPVALQGLMGEANLCYARGQTDLAEKVCLEIIRQVPLAPEPFLTLAQIHENNPDKYMQFSLIAAHLNPGDIHQWVRIAELSLEQGNVKQAINCFMKATKYNPRDIDLRLRRIELLKSIGEEKLAFRCYFSMLAYIPMERPDFLLDTAKSVANQLLKENNTSKAYDAINCAYTKIPQFFKTEDIHFYLELLISNGMYQSVVDVLSTHVALDITYSEPDGLNILDIIIPNNIILDFRSKLIVSLIHLRLFHLLQYLIENIFAFISIEEAGDCYLDIAEALMKEERFSDALKLLIPLVESNNFSLAAVWLRHADCYRAIGSLDEAINSYSQVVKLAPQHFDARLTLSALLKQVGRNSDAMAVLEQDIENEMIDPYVLYERCIMLKENGNLKQYVDVGFLLLSRHCMKLRNREELQIVTTIVKFSSKISLIKENRESRAQALEDNDGPEFIKSDTEPTVAAEWDLFKDIVRCACETKRFPMMQKIVFTIKTAKRFSSYYKELDFMAMLSAFYNRDSTFSYTLTKEFLIKNIEIPRAWNFFNSVLQFTEDNRYFRFLLRLFKRNKMITTNSLIVRANYFLLSGSYKYAINNYMNILRPGNVDDAPLVHLLIAVTFSHFAQQKNIDKKHVVIAQAMAFCAKYREQRESVAEHEVHYNLGRLYHQFGIMHFAIIHYNQVLTISDPLVEENAEYLDLKREAAFNLHLIYKSNGNFEMARKILFEYLVV